MTPEEIRKHDEEMVDKILRRAAIFAEGVQSPFWAELKKMFAEEREKALNEFSNIPYNDAAAIIEQQIIAKVGKYIESRIQGAIDESESLIQ